MADERTSEYHARATATREDGTNLDDVRLIGNDDSEQQPHDHITSSPRRSNKGARVPPMCAAICSARALPSDNKFLAPITWHLCSKQNQTVGFFPTNVRAVWRWVAVFSNQFKSRQITTVSTFSRRAIYCAQNDFKGLRRLRRAVCRCGQFGRCDLFGFSTGYAISEFSIVYAQNDFKGLQRAVCGWVGFGRLGLRGFCSEGSAIRQLDRPESVGQPAGRHAERNGQSFCRFEARYRRACLGASDRSIGQTGRTGERSHRQARSDADRAQSRCHAIGQASVDRSHTRKIESIRQKSRGQSKRVSELFDGINARDALP